MADPNDFNASIITEFRANAGKVGGPFEGATLLLLHSTGAKSGEARVHPLMYSDLDGRHVIFASAAGAPNHPAWYHNLLAHPEASIEVGTESVEILARVTEGVKSGDLEGWELDRVRRNSLILSGLIMLVSFVVLALGVVLADHEYSYVLR